jgi:23S rRNA (pseudouridine1915-N3)-methyltransferase
VALEFQVLWAGRNAPAEWEALCREYRRRIAAWHPIHERAVRAATASDDPARRRVEGTALAAAAARDGFWVALDRRGRAVDSEALAREVGRWRAEWSRPVVFLLGSDLGLDPDLVARCRWRMSLGPLTLPHALARLVLLEQLYRALSILEGIQYHRRPF